MVAKVRLGDAEFLVLAELAEHAGQSEEEYVRQLIRDAAWREVTRQKEGGDVRPVEVTR